MDAGRDLRKTTKDDEYFIEEIFLSIFFIQGILMHCTFKKMGSEKTDSRLILRMIIFELIATFLIGF